MVKRYIVTLTEEERRELERMISAGKTAARKLQHARILLKADAAPGGPGWPDDAIVEAVDVSRRTVERVRQQFVEEGLEVALERRKPRREYQHKLDGRAEARLIAVTCGPVPQGRKRWTLRLLAKQLVALEVVDSISHECVRRTLKKTN